MEITADYPIIRDGYDLEDGIKYPKFKHRGDFTLVLTGKLKELDSIESLIEPIIDKCDSQQIHCTKDY